MINTFFSNLHKRVGAFVPCRFSIHPLWSVVSPDLGICIGSQNSRTQNFSEAVSKLPAKGAVNNRIYSRV